MESENLIRHELRDLMEQYQNLFSIPIYRTSEINQIVDCSLLIIKTRDGIQEAEKGSFVESFINNDLESAVENADPILLNAICFFVYVKNNYNISHEESIKNQIKRIHKRATEIVESNLDWDDKYALIFSDDISSKVFKLCHLEYYDPDTTYEEDTLAFYRALTQKIECYDE